MTGLTTALLGATSSRRDQVALKIAAFLINTEMERLRLFRMHLQTSLSLVSPLLLDFATSERVSLGNALADIFPPRTWPARPLDGFPIHLRHALLHRKTWRRASSSRDAWHFERTFASPGVVIRTTHHPKGRFAIRPCGQILGFTAAIGPCFLSVFGRVAVLKLTVPAPEIVLASLTGRMIDQVVDHPIFLDRNYVVRRATTNLEDGLPVFAFNAKLKPFEGPWESLQ